MWPSLLRTALFLLCVFMHTFLYAGVWAEPAVPIPEQNAQAALPLNLIITSYERSTPLYETFIQGTTSPNTKVTIQSEAYSSSVVADQTGNFILTKIPLHDGTNRFTLTVSDNQGQTGSRVLVIKGGRYYELNLTGLVYLDVQKVMAARTGAGGWSTDSAAAFYADAMLAGTYRLVAAYDTRGPLANEAVYRQHLGDSSITEQLAKSAGNGYFRIEKGKNTFFWGDYSTRQGTGEFSAYNRYLTGPKLQVEGNANNNTWAGTLYGARTAAIPVSECIPGKGISGFYQLNHYHITPGSEQIALVTMDPTQPEVPIAVQPMRSSIDYTINYENGTLLFQKPVPAHDELLHPVMIAITYEALPDGSEANTIAGGHVSVFTKSGAQFGAGTVFESGLRPFTLVSTETSVPFQNKVTLATEAAFSRLTSMTGSGMANGFGLKLDLKKVDEANPATWHLGYRLTNGSFTVQPVPVISSSTQQINLDIAGPVAGGINGKVALGWRGESAFHRNTLNGNLTASKTWFDKLTWKSSLLGSRVQQQMEADTTSTSVSTRLGTELSYRLGEGLDVGLGREVASQSGSTPTVTGTTGLKAVIGLNDKTEATLGWHKADTGKTGISTGVRHKLLDQQNGNATLFSEYQIAGAQGGLQGRGNIGIDAAWQVLPSLRFDVGYQANSPAGPGLYQAGSPLPPTADGQSGWLGWEILPQGGPKLTTRLEASRLGDRTTRLLTLGGLAKLSDSISGQVKAVWGSTSDGSTLLSNRLEEDIQLAFRPAYVSGLAALLSYKRQRGGLALREESNLQDEDAGLRDVAEAGIEFSAQLTTKWELGARYATRNVFEADSAATKAATFSRLRQVRAGYAFLPQWQVATEVRLIDQPATASWRSGWALALSRDFALPASEVRSVLADGWRIEAGYRYLGTGDASPWEWQSGPYFRVGKRF